MKTRTARLGLTVTKETRELFKAKADAKGVSMNNLFTEMVYEMEHKDFLKETIREEMAKVIEESK